ncbi:MAG: ABC transporter ATP-binding protein [Thermodesulfobacteriota bacterium]|nr:MAG: ABC transporter ATP-binding protein [Thermodesulfobacteriota bacterium]
MAENLLSVKNLSAGYRDIKIIEEVSLYVNEGEIVTIVGPNGSGKTTLLRSIVGVIEEFNGKIMGGEVLYSGKRINGKKSFELIKLGIVFVPDSGKVFPSMTVQENLEMGGYILNNESVLKERIKDVLELFPILKPLLSRRADSLSGGERQMLSLARGLLTDPKLLILDEPSAGLSPNYVKILFAKLREIANKRKGVMIVEQNAKTALKFSDRGCVLKNGKVAIEGEAKELIEREDVFKLL